MRILYVAFKYDYGKPEQGYSFEHYNFYDALVKMGNDVLYFDSGSHSKKHGVYGTNQLLTEIVKAKKPDLVFCVLVSTELDPTAVNTISHSGSTITLNWFCDDHWRFDNYSRHWAPHFNWVVTTAVSALPKYAQLGYRNVIKSQWACNHFSYRPLNLPLQYAVTFIGQPHGNRRAVIGSLRQADLTVRAWGSGWESGRVHQDEMIRVFNQSRINLNLSNASVSGKPPSTAETSARRLVSRLLARAPGGNQIKQWYQERSAHIANTMQYADQIKGRNFEIPGCGGFLLTGQAENFGDYFAIGKEIVCFDDTRDLIEKTRYYLAHEDERASIARAGFTRTMCEHTYAHRFVEIFDRLGLPHPPLNAILAGQVPAGQTEEVT